LILCEIHIFFLARSICTLKTPHRQISLAKKYHNIPNNENDTPRKQYKDFLGKKTKKKRKKERKAVHLTHDFEEGEKLSYPCWCYSITCCLLGFTEYKYGCFYLKIY
jgi:hypothetical protein